MLRPLALAAAVALVLLARPAAAEDAPPPEPDFQGIADLGLVVVSGNTETTTLNGSLRSRETNPPSVTVSSPVVSAPAPPWEAARRPAIIPHSHAPGRTKIMTRPKRAPHSPASSATATMGRRSSTVTSG